MISRPSAPAVRFPVDWADNPELPIATVATSHPGLTEDAELIAHLRAGGSSDLDLLFDRYSRLVLATARRVLGDLNEAEEVLQEVFFYVYRKPELFDPSKGSLKAWIIQITFCRALDRKLYLARRRHYTSADIDSLQVRGETDLEREIEAKLSRKHLERACAELTAMQRRTIELFYFEGLGLREIGQQLRQPLGRVRHHLYRGLERLRKSVLLRRLRRK